MRVETEQSDSAFKALAAKELAGTAEAELPALADGWWDAATKLKETGFKKSAQSHAVGIYRRAVQSANGLQRVRMEERIAQAPATPRNDNPFLGDWEKQTMSGGKKYSILPGGKIVSADGHSGRWVIKDKKLYIVVPGLNVQVYDPPKADNTMTGSTIPSSPKEGKIPLLSRRTTNSNEHN